MPAERTRLQEAAEKVKYWRRWGPYLTERSWGNPREDYSAEGTPWDYFTHDHSRSRAYRWTEDGIAGICDNHQRLCFAFAFWNGADPSQAAARRDRIRADRHRNLRRKPLLRHLHRICQTGCRRYSGARHRHQ